MLSSIGEGMAAAPGWAGFWDLLLLSDARQRGLALPDGFGDLSRALEAAKGEPGAIRPLEQFRPDWREAVPAYAKSLMNGGI